MSDTHVLSVALPCPGGDAVPGPGALGREFISNTTGCFLGHSSLLDGAHADHTVVQCRRTRQKWELGYQI